LEEINCIFKARVTLENCSTGFAVSDRTVGEDCFFVTFLSLRCPDTRQRLLTVVQNCYTFWFVLKINIPCSLCRENRRRRFEKFNSRTVCSVCSI